MFCPRCSGLLMPNEGKMKCSCGYVQNDGTLTEKKKKTKDVQVVQEKFDESLPKIKHDCSECKNREAYFWTRQMRSSDEPESKFYKCTKCSKIDRED
ncbi:transcription factor S [Candidatus Woesearchaeota archaeon]|nr:transcription factor S [Candidatus Woesearchaeota archaeon]